MIDKLLNRNRKAVSAIDDILLATNPWNMTVEERVSMTCSCHDTDYIPKVKYAGTITETKSTKIQIMHNGLKLVYGGYHGDWMAEIITTLKGHHEPQEEKAFYEVMRVLKSTKQKSFSIIELGSFWSYYSLWFLKELPNSKAFCFEPDPVNLSIGKKNAIINSLSPIFESAAAGSEDGKIISLPLDSDPSQNIDVKIRSVDSIVNQHKLKQVDILHMDVQGVELDTLEGALQTIINNKIRFLFVSTHHYSFSKDVATHQKCLEFITKNGGKIIASHNVLESYSGDGLIVASFDDKDKKFIIETSNNSSEYSLFRSYERDMQLLIDYIQNKK
jgi:FkbM family methyltransferase